MDAATETLKDDTKPDMGMKAVASAMLSASADTPEH